MTTREYYIGKKKRTIEELDDVVALQMAKLTAAPVNALGTSVSHAPRNLPARTAIPDDVASAFARANWHFVVPSPGLRADLAGGTVLAPVADTGRVFQRPDGTVVVATTELTVQLRPELSKDQVKEALRDRSLEVIRPIPFAENTYQVKAAGRPDSLAASQELQGDDRFTFADPSLVQQIGGRTAPDDPRYREQWQWHNPSLAQADAHLEGAWEYTRGAGVRVAVIDNGFDPGHPDLAPGVDQNSGYIDSDGTFVFGIEGMPADEFSHGTFCAGMVGARADNSTGGCGAAPECSLMLIACLGDQVGTQATLARTAAYAANPTLENSQAQLNGGADIIVCSLGPNGAVWEMETVLDLALTYAAQQGRSGRGCAVFWASSNGNNVDIALDEVVSHPDVIAVGRSTRFDTEHNSARGPKLEYLAPGVDVLSTTAGGGYGIKTGTSFAAPCAAGVAALALASNPAMDRDMLRQVMVESCDKIGDVAYDAQGHNDEYGYGRVNAEAAVQRARAAAGTADTGQDLYRVEFRATSIAELRSSLDGTNFDLGCRPAVRRGADGLVVEAYATKAQIDGFQASRAGGSVTVDVRENATQVGRDRQQRDVSRQNRFAARELPKGLGIKE